MEDASDDGNAPVHSRWKRSFDRAIAGTDGPDRSLEPSESRKHSIGIRGPAVPDPMMNGVRRGSSERWGIAARSPRFQDMVLLVPDARRARPNRESQSPSHR